MMLLMRLNNVVVACYHGTALTEIVTLQSVGMLLSHGTSGHTPQTLVTFLSYGL